MNLLRLVSWPYMRQHVLRTAMTTAGIRWRSRSSSPFSGL